MDKNKIIVIFISILLFLLFSVFQYQKSKCYDILEIKTPFSYVIDFNRNGLEDDGELVAILQGYDYVCREKIFPEKLSEKYGLSDYDLIALSYLTEKFVSESLKDKSVMIRDNRIFLSNTDFCEKLKNSGYVFKDFKPVCKEGLEKNLEYIKSSKLVLYNAKSNKYHKLDCKYGLMAHNYLCIPKSQLPTGAKACKFCHVKKENHTDENIQRTIYVKPPSLSITNDDMKVMFLDYTTKLKPDRKCNTELCRELVNYIRNSKNTIDMAIYGYDRVPVIEKELKNAIARGVRVRLVYDIDSKNSNIYKDTNYFVAFIKNAVNDKALFDGSSANAYTNSIMHNKFYIFDDEIVVTGSANLSYTDMSGYNANNVVIFNSKKIAQIYKQEFEQMYNSKFHYLKTPLESKENITLGSSTVSVYFSPKDSIIEKVIVPIVDKAHSYIYIPAFLITDKKLAEALINAKARGVDVKVILDATNAKNPYSKHHLLRQHGILVKTETFAGKLHSKTLISDNKYSVIGSMNFSKSGEKKNDENVVVINNPKIAMFNKIFFEYLWKKIDNYWLTHDANSEGLDSVGSCSDGIDNDYDGKTDMEDEGCHIYKGKYVH